MGVSPGLTLRPSLSVPGGRRSVPHHLAVSPGLTLRPSLSVVIANEIAGLLPEVSPGLTLRPSLSGDRVSHIDKQIAQCRRG